MSRWLERTMSKLWMDSAYANNDFYLIIDHLFVVEDP